MDTEKFVNMNDQSDTTSYRSGSCAVLSESSTWSDLQVLDHHLSFLFSSNNETSHH